MAWYYDGIDFRVGSVITAALMNDNLRGVAMDEVKLTKDVLKKNRFYVGSPNALRQRCVDGSYGGSWGKETLKDAVEHAKELVEKTGSDQFIVQIIRVVRRKQQPVVVETVK